MSRMERWRWVAFFIVAFLVAGCAGGGSSSADTGSAAPPSRAGSSPAGTGASSPAGVREVIDVLYARALTGDAKDVSLDVYAPPTKRRWPVVIYGPGGGETKINGIAFGRELAARGAVVFVIDIHHGVSVGDKPLGIASRSIYEQAACAVRMARSMGPGYGGDPDRLAWTGWSFGGVVGFELALTDPGAEAAWDRFVAGRDGPSRQYECVAPEGAASLQALVTSGSARMLDAWPDAYAADPELAAFVDSINRIGNNPDVKVRMIHGTDDDEVPFALGEALAPKLKAASYDVELIPIEGGRHSQYPDILAAKALEALGP